MRTAIFALAAASALVTAPAWAQDAGSFRLPGNTPSAAPQQQGPVAPDVPESRVRQATPAPAVTSAPAPTPSPVPTIAPPAPAPVPTAAASPAPSTAAPRPRAIAAPTPAPTNAVPATAAPAAPQAATSPASAPSAAPSFAPVVAPETKGNSRFPWMWLLGALIALGAGAATWLVWQRRERVAAAAVPEIERPRVAAADVPARPAPPPPLPAAPAEPLQLALEPLRLSLTLMNAALTYRLEIANHGIARLANLVVEADMISAHASLPREQQLAGPDGAASCHRIEALEPGESRVVEGEFRLPFGRIVPIRQGNVSMMLPLARFRAQADGTRPVVRTFAVGQPGASGLQPFRLDQGPRIYPQLVQRAFA